MGTVPVKGDVIGDFGLPSFDFSRHDFVFGVWAFL